MGETEIGGNAVDSEQEVCIGLKERALDGELQYLHYPSGGQGFLCGLQPTVVGSRLGGEMAVVVGRYGRDRHSGERLPDDDASEQGEQYVSALFHLCVGLVLLYDLVHELEQFVTVFGSKQLYAGLFEVGQSFEDGSSGKVPS